MAGAGNGVRIVIPSGVRGDGVVFIVSNDPLFGRARVKYLERALLR